MKQVIQLNENDNVIIACGNFAPHQNATHEVQCQQPIPFGHKIAVSKIPLGHAIVKYGQVIGHASETIFPGEHVHVHNVRYTGSQSKAAQPEAPLTTSDAPAAFFKGYLRANGKVGTRNYVGVMATVNCAATVVAKIAQNLQLSNHINHPCVDGVVPIVHQSGCGIPASTKSELTQLQQLLRGYLNHPNFYGWVIIGLGCEVNQITNLLDTEELKNAARIKTVGIQEVGGTSKALSAGMQATEQLLEQAKQCVRTSQSASHLTLGLQCGGSDAWSGVTANPGLGVASDLLIASGGSSILAETPEIYGAEALLYERAVSDEVKQSLAQKIQFWRDYMAMANSDLNNNPSPGNLKGGITTILEKSLGAVAKSGQSPLQEVLDYGEPATQKGLLFMDSPGFDPCSVTGEIASGANVVCFTTGRGSTFGAAGAPCLKLASNSQLFGHMTDDMDINCGEVINGELTLEQLGQHIFEEVLAVASGKQTKSESLGLGHYEFVPWQKGVVV